MGSLVRVIASPYMGWILAGAVASDGFRSSNGFYANDGVIVLGSLETVDRFGIATRLRALARSTP